MRAIVTVGFRSPTYVTGVKRLVASAERVAPDVAVLAWMNEYPPGCPDHRVVPFAFKPYALEDAARQGYTSIVWLDSCSIIQRDLAPFWEAVERDGYYVVHDGWSTGQWCSDRALGQLDITREEAFSTYHLHAGCIGLDLTSDIGASFLASWFDYASPGGPFCGPWHTGDEVSVDPRVLGHRHDQTVASVVATRLGMIPVRLDASLYAYEVDRPEACFLGISPWSTP